MKFVQNQIRSALFLIAFVSNVLTRADEGNEEVEDPSTSVGLSFHITNQVTMIPDANGGFRELTANEIRNEIYTSEGAEVMTGSDGAPVIEMAFDVDFFLYTRQNPVVSHWLLHNSTSHLKTSHFNPQHPTRIIVHGWRNDRDSSVNAILRDAFLNKSDYNVIVVDWSEGASSLYYPTSRNRVKYVGYKVAKFIDFLFDDAKMNIDTLMLVGHSLGAHICGIAGKFVNERVLKTIVGLDPAGPLFSIDYPQERLDADDAEYVEVIHTNGGFLGFLDPLGDVDFYLNGGKKQPGCGVDLMKMCAHSRAYEYFAESILENERFWSMPCHFSEIDDTRCTRVGFYGTMGGEVTRMKRMKIFGVYILQTAESAPFAIGRSGGS